MKLAHFLFLIITYARLFSGQEIELPESIEIKGYDSELSIEVPRERYNHSETIENLLKEGKLSENNVLDLSLNSVLTQDVLNNIFVNFFNNKEDINNYLENEFIRQGITNQLLLNHAYACRYLDLQVFLNAIREVFYRRIPSYVFNKDEWDKEQKIKDYLESKKLLNKDVLRFSTQLTNISNVLKIQGYDSKLPIEVPRERYEQSKVIMDLFQLGMYNPIIFKDYSDAQLTAVFEYLLNAEGYKDYYAEGRPKISVAEIRKMYLKDKTNAEARAILEIVENLQITSLLPVVKRRVVGSLAYWLAMRTTIQKWFIAGFATTSVVALTIYNNLHTQLFEYLREFIRTPS
jgi:hypothetical protein